jgi:HD-GYP domain-containing protein (c-di-GMP phosphodiesterase class II)
MRVATASDIKRSARLRKIMENVGEHHRETYRHLHTVHDLCYALARTLDYDAAYAEAIALAGLLHDVGKLRLTKETLDAPRKLTNGEWHLVMAHAMISRELIEESVDEQVASWVERHHERLDGSGYPNKLDRTVLSRETMVVACVDVWDASGAPRPYTRTRSLDDRLRIMAGERLRIGEEVMDAFFATFGLDPASLPCVPSNGSSSFNGSRPSNGSRSSPSQDPSDDVRSQDDTAWGQFESLPEMFET